MLNNIGLPGLLLLAIAAWYLFIHFKISRRMGFSKNASFWIMVSSLFGVAVIIWWLAKWPNETGLATDDGAIV